MIERHYSNLKVIQTLNQFRCANTRRLIDTHSAASDSYQSKKLIKREFEWVYVKINSSSSNTVLVMCD